MEPLNNNYNTASDDEPSSVYSSSDSDPENNEDIIRRALLQSTPVKIKQILDINDIGTDEINTVLDEWSLYEEHQEALEQLLRVSFSCPDGSYGTPLHIAFENGFWDFYRHRDAPNHINLVWKGRLPLNQAVEHQDINVFDIISTVPGLKVNAKNAYGQNPLHIAASNNNHEKYIERLIEMGASLTGRDQGGNSPFDIAVEASNVRFIRSAIVHLNENAKTVIFSENSQRTTILDQAFTQCLDCRSTYLSLDVLKVLLSHYYQPGINDFLTKTIDGEPLLHVAIKNQKHDLANIIVDNYLGDNKLALLSATNSHNQNAASYIAQHGSWKLLSDLVNKSNISAQESIEIRYAFDTSGKNALYYIVHNDEFINYLINNDLFESDLLAVRCDDNTGNTVMHEIARQVDETAVSKILQHYTPLQQQEFLLQKNNSGQTPIDIGLATHPGFWDAVKQGVDPDDEFNPQPRFLNHSGMFTEKRNRDENDKNQEPLAKKHKA